MKSIAIKSIASGTHIFWAGAAFGHEGHGFMGSHWHVSDVAGLVALGALIAAAIWLSKK